MWRTWVLLVAMVVLLSASSAADTKRVLDQPAHDSKSAFDIEWVKHGHDARKLTHVISTYDRWRTPELGDNGKFHVNISAGADPSNGLSAIIIIYLDEGKLVSKMYRFPARGGAWVVGRPPVTRPTARSVKVTFPKRFIKRGLQAYRWQAFVADQQVDDFVPSEDGFILHRM